MDEKALTKLTYGLYVIGAYDVANKRFAGCVADAVMQTTCNPPALVVSCQKRNHTAKCMAREKKFSLSVLPAHTPPDLIAAFGFQSSLKTDKWAMTAHEFLDALPVLPNVAARLTARVTKIEDLGTHFLFFAEVESAQDGDKAPLSYSDYKQNLRSASLCAYKDGIRYCDLSETKKTEKDDIMNDKKEENEEKWVCAVCGYVYDGDIPFEDLPDDYVCPVCGVPKSEFVKE